MGKFGDYVNAAQTGFNIVNSIFGPSVKKQVSWQKKAQMELNEQAAQLNYEYGEKAAQNAYARQMEMYERSYKDQSYGAMRKQMEDANLSVGLMYGGSGSGGGQGSMTGAPQGATGGAIAGDAAAQLSAAIEMKRLKLQETATIAQNTKALAEAQEIKSREKKNEAETQQIQTTTKQAQDSFEWALKDMEETAKGKWLENAAKRFNMEMDDMKGSKKISDEKFGDLTIKAGAIFNNEVIARGIDQALKKEDIEGANLLRKAQALFEDEKTKHYATQIFTAVRMADIAEKQVAIDKMKTLLQAIDTHVKANMAQAEIAKIAQDMILNPAKVAAEIDKLEASAERDEFETGAWAKIKIILEATGTLAKAYSDVMGGMTKAAGVATAAAK